MSYVQEVDAAWDLTKREPLLQRLNSYKYTIRTIREFQQLESYFIMSAYLIYLNLPDHHMRCISLERCRNYKKKKKKKNILFVYSLFLIGNWLDYHCYSRIISHYVSKFFNGTIPRVRSIARELRG